MPPTKRVQERLEKWGIGTLLYYNWGSFGDDIVEVFKVVKVTKTAFVIEIVPKWVINTESAQHPKYKKLIKKTYMCDPTASLPVDDTGSQLWKEYIAAVQAKDMDKINELKATIKPPKVQSIPISTPDMAELQIDPITNTFEVVTF